MTDLELMEATIKIARDTRHGLTLDVMGEIQRRLAGHLLPSPPKSANGKRASRAAYMRAYRNKKRANPFA